MPAISADQRTYTFQIRNDFQFSPPENSFVTAQSMKYTFEANAQPQTWPRRASSSSGTSSGRREYMNGQAPEITGIVASGDTLTIQLIQPQGDFLTFLAMPFTCAVPISLPPVEQLGPSPRPAPTTSQRTASTSTPSRAGIPTTTARDCSTSTRSSTTST